MVQSIIHRKDSQRKMNVIKRKWWFSSGGWESERRERKAEGKEVVERWAGVSEVQQHSLWDWNTSLCSITSHFTLTSSH